MSILFFIFIDIFEYVLNYVILFYLQLDCCGIGGPTDYRKSKAVPWSCCKRNLKELSGDCPSVHQHGCLLDVYDEVYHCLTYSALSSFGMAIIQVMNLTMSMFRVLFLLKLKHKMYPIAGRWRGSLHFVDESHTSFSQ